jgi:hypothetical protein
VFYIAFVFNGVVARDKHGSLFGKAKLGKIVARILPSAFIHSDFIIIEEFEIQGDAGSELPEI